MPAFDKATSYHIVLSHTGTMLPVKRLDRWQGNGHQPSLLAWATDEELTDTKLRYQFDKAKPFRSRHAQQIKLLDEPELPTRDLDELYSEIIQSISPILALLSEKYASLPKLPHRLMELCVCHR